MNGETLDQIMQVLRVQDLTPLELLTACKEGYRMDTLSFTEAVTVLENTGLVRRVNIILQDNSGATVYRLCKVRN